ncbi:uncharacterized protein PFL1_01784 [Pseudozyma flocculosa PF-1]|uniref:Related to GYP1 - GTPase activating protein n=1 Tax=Pseudozyma flocculosa TaxID=84751 RepID=A0A5C3EWX3_9BASI|nr:uncharacterized protein PFL1_01784 [Pseudozyma flocculosa PF-1]EPQ30887.1 hypothetical protein PFL1_01784 [Pseudozyma flocculosa PF-1]SPO36734.1 related to GYP1 - GTPase activating protein [Pseudozyma flocculosa]
MPPRASHQHASSSTSHEPGDFDDQAWGIESDDDDFVSRVAPRTNVPRSLKSNSRSSSYLSQSSQQQAGSPADSRSPSLPRPGASTPAIAIAVPSRSSAGSGSSTAANAISTPGRPPSQSPAGISATADGEPSSLHSTSSGQRGTSWTMVDNFAARGSSPANGGTEAPIVGSPPTDVAVDLRRDGSGTGSGSGFQLVASEEAATGEGTAGSEAGQKAAGRAQVYSSQSGAYRDTKQDDSDVEAEEVDLNTGRTVLRKRSARRKAESGKSEADALTGAIRPDLDHLIKDPTHALARLSLCWTGPSSSGDTPMTEAGSAPDSATSERMAIGITPSASTDFQFDPVAAAGDGLIMAGPSFADAEPAGQNGVVTSISGSIVPVTTPGGLGSTVPNRKRSIRTSRRRQQLLSCLGKPSIDISVLRSLAWAGVPDELRPVVWQLLLGYLPTVAAVRAQTLSRKRAEYASGVKLAFAKGIAGLDQAIWHQIHIDVPRTNPGIRLWQREATQRALERILYVWAIRHPASGYVQGINDLATPFFEVFLSAYIDSDPEMYDVSLLPPEALEALEADTFWCLSKLLDGIQDNYIFAQPGIQRQVRRMGELVARIDAPLHAHLQAQGVEYMQFAFRWMNCLLMREMSVRNIIRMWDTYLAEGQDAFSDFHLYVCSVFLHKWSKELMDMDFQGIIMYLQSLPTQGWSDKDAEMLLSEAFMYKTLFGNTAHLNK